MKIGVTSQNLRTITGHAGSARRFMIFEVSSEDGVQQTGKLDLPKEMSIHEYCSDAPHPIDGLDVLITGSCGDGFLRKLAARGVRVVVTGETDPLTAVTAVSSGAALPPPLPDDGDHHICECHCAGESHAAG